MSKASKRWIGVVILVAAFAAAAWQFIPGRIAATQEQLARETPDAASQPSDTTLPAPAGDQPVVASASPVAAAETSQPAASQPASAPASEPAAAMTDMETLAAFNRGMELSKSGKLIEARSVLSKAFYSGRLTADQQKQAISELTVLSQQTLFSPMMYDNDPYVVNYFVQPGDVLQMIERRLTLHVPSQLICKLNNVSDPSKIQSGQRLKLIQGPFHAVVRKSDFTMDIYLQREGMEKIFVKRLTVGLGTNNCTPPGRWHVAKGQKAWHPIYNPAPNSPNRGKGPIEYGQPDYAFGQVGLWIGLEGLEDSNKMLHDYGIHSTNHPESIGKAESEGCVRVADADMEEVFTLLYEVWSTVEILP